MAATTRRFAKLCARGHNVSVCGDATLIGETACLAGLVHVYTVEHKA